VRAVVEAVEAVEVVETLEVLEVMEEAPVWPDHRPADTRCTTNMSSEGRDAHDVRTCQ
jgi:hypothetical protein